jgi:hypothetical protein
VIIDSADLILTIGYLILEAESIEVVVGEAATVSASFVAYDHETGFGLGTYTLKFETDRPSGTPVAIDPSPKFPVLHPAEEVQPYQDATAGRADKSVLCGTERTLEKIAERFTTIIGEVSSPGSGKGMTVNLRCVGHPAVILPGKPRLTILVVNAYGAVEEFRQLDPPAGSAFDGIIRLNPANDDDLVSLVDHVE